MHAYYDIVIIIVNICTEVITAKKWNFEFPEMCYNNLIENIMVFQVEGGVG